MVLSEENETQHTLPLLSRDNTVFLRVSLFFLLKLAGFVKETFNWSLFREFGIYLFFVFYQSAARGCRQLRRRKGGGIFSNIELKNA